MVDFNEEYKKANNVFQKFKAQVDVMTKQIEEYTKRINHLNVILDNTDKARIITQKVAEDIQHDLEERITKIVSMALAAVFEDPYEFKVSFVTRRNQTECDMLFVKDGNECDPMESSGGGAIDIASIALRMAIWSIKKTRAIQILDEPAKFLSRDMQDKASKMLKTLSEDLGIQMVIVTHIPELMESADKVFLVEQKDGISKVKAVS